MMPHQASSLVLRSGSPALIIIRVLIAPEVVVNVLLLFLLFRKALTKCEKVGANERRLRHTRRLHAFAVLMGISPPSLKRGESP